MMRVFLLVTSLLTLTQACKTLNSKKSVNDIYDGYDHQMINYKILNNDDNITVNVVEGDILVEVDRVEAGAPGVLHAVVITDTDRSALNMNTPREV